MKKIVVAGASAGGLEALAKLVTPLPRDFPAPVLVVQHMAPDVTGEVLVKGLQRASQLPCELARDGEKLRPARIYIAPPDHHMLVTQRGTILISKGARENRSRPGIDPLFRSAAVAFRARVVGVLMTGFLDDGVSGLLAIKACGGTCIVQDPRDAAYPDMPRNALNNLRPDHCVSADEIGKVLMQAVKERLRRAPPVPANVILEAEIAERVVSDVAAVDQLGRQVPFNCPDCGGVLWEVRRGKLLRYRCHTGHAFSASVLLAEQTRHIEETLWVALRMFEERKNLINTMADPKREGFNRAAAERVKESAVHIERIRSILLASPKSRLHAGAGNG